MSRKQKLTRDEHISLGTRFVDLERRLVDLAREIGAAYPLSSKQIKKVWRTIALLTETRMALDYAAGNEYPDLPGAYCNNSEHRVHDEQEAWHTCPLVVGKVERGQLIVKCPHCGREHVHSRGTGHVMSDCIGSGAAGYVIVDPEDPREFTWRTPAWRI